MVGESTRAFLATGISKATQDNFFSNVVKFYQAACQYIKDSMLVPAKDDPHPAITLWKHAEVNSVLFFCYRIFFII